VLIRRDTLFDRDAIFAVNVAAFARPEYLVAPEARLIDELREAGDMLPSLSLVAELDPRGRRPRCL
jgi:predicted N-acetyltransferase YhbS